MKVIRNLKGLLVFFTALFCLSFAGCDLLSRTLEFPTGTTEEQTTDPEDPNKDPEEPSTDPEDPNTDPEDPSTDPIDNTDPTTQTPYEVFQQCIVDEMNFARTKPALYVKECLNPLVGKGSASYEKNLSSLIQTMNTMQSTTSFKLEKGGLSKAAQEWCDIQGRHRKALTAEWHGHEGLEGTLPVSTRRTFDRIKQYCTYTEAGEDIAYSQDLIFSSSDGAKIAAKKAIIQLLVDEGVEDLGHRKSILGTETNYEVAGVGVGIHGYYGGMCVIDLASGYKEHAFVENKPTITPADVDENNIEDIIFEVYDDKAKFKDIKYNSETGKSYVKIGNWYVTKSYEFYFFKESEKANYPSAVYDTHYQYWTFRSGHYYTSHYKYDWYQNTAHFDDNPEEILSELIEEIDPSIPLNRDEIDLEVNYNVVFVPLSTKDASIAKVKNYNWEEDKDFADFVTWMEKSEHNISSSSIDFYKKMARYPNQRGAFVPVNTDNKSWYTGIDSKFVENLEDPDGGYAGGMQLFFDLRKNEKRLLFRNKVIPILLVHIKDTDGTMPDLDFDFEEEYKKIKEELDASPFTNTFEIYTVEVSLKYATYKETYSTSYTENWYDAWDAIISQVEEEDPVLANKFKDNTKSGIIRYFDTERMNESCGSLNASRGVRLWYIMSELGYERTIHLNIFGSELKHDAPGCFAKDCLHERTICPLCLYSYGID